MAMPNAEKIAKAILTDSLDVEVFQTPPRKPPDTYIRLARAGGVMRNRVTDSATIVVSCYSNDPSAAADLANSAREVFAAARASTVDGAWIRWWVEMAGPAYYPDPDKPDRYRYQFSGELRLATN